MAQKRDNTNSNACARRGTRARGPALLSNMRDLIAKAPREARFKRGGWVSNRLKGDNAAGRLSARPCYHQVDRGGLLRGNNTRSGYLCPDGSWRRDVERMVDEPFHLLHELQGVRELRVRVERRLAELLRMNEKQPRIACRGISSDLQTTGFVSCLGYLCAWCTGDRLLVPSRA